ncbi:MAG: hypothetical protein ACR2QT_12235 [Woeseiaceae bacterium]
MQRFLRICANCGQFGGVIGLISALLTTLSACQPASETTAAVVPEAAPAAEISYQCGADGFLETRLFGGLDLELNWRASDLNCEGMPRPDGDGARLRFAGDASDGRRIAFIIALPDMQRGAAGAELKSTVTVIEEGQGRFFSTADAEVCWTDITNVAFVADSDAIFSVSGNLYCVAPLAQINGDSDVLIPDLKFRGLLDWNAS